MLLVPDKAAFQNSLSGLPLVTYQPGETVIVDGSTTGRVADPQEGQCRGREGGHRDCYGGGARRCFWRAFDLPGSAAHGGCARLGNLAVLHSRCHRASHAKSDGGTIYCNSAGTPARWRQSHARSTKAPTGERRAAQRGHHYLSLDALNARPNL